MKTRLSIVSMTEIEPSIKTVRGRAVIIDSDLARIYGVETKALNRAVKRNAARFPPEFAFVLTRQEVAALRYQIGAAKTGRGGRTSPEVAYTEHGALMASAVLQSDRAVAMSVYIIRAFLRIRNDLAASAAIFRRLAEIDKNLLTHDAALRDIYEKLRPLLTPPPSSPRREIGYHTLKQ